VQFRTRSSHVRVYESCARKWFRNEVEGLPDPDTVAKTFGTNAHAIQEAWLRDGKPHPFSKEGIAARRAVPHLPAPGEGLGVEHKIEKVLGDGTIYTGAIDLVDLRPTSQLRRTEQGRFIRLYDHKFTAALKFAKTAEELSRDVSAVFYAMEVKRLTEDPIVNGRWVYSERNGNGVLPVDFTITGVEMRERWAKTLGSVAEMRKLAEQKPQWTEVTPDYNACDAFGGCQFRAQCALRKAQSKMGMLDDLKAKLPVGQGVAAPAAAAQPQAAVAAKAPQSPLAKLLAAKKAPTVQALVTEAPVQLEPGEMDGTGEEGAELGNVPAVPMATEPVTGIIPPDAPAPDLQKDTVEKRKRTKREKTLDVLAAPGMQEALAQDQAKLEALGAFSPPEALGVIFPPSAAMQVESQLPVIVGKLRKRAEALMGVEALPREVPLELFRLANWLERGDL
jgi:hypothetical protein